LAWVQRLDQQGRVVVGLGAVVLFQILIGEGTLPQQVAHWPVVSETSAEKKDVDAQPKAGHDEQELF
jgi:hypothetical protein